MYASKVSDGTNLNSDRNSYAQDQLSDKRFIRSMRVKNFDIQSSFKDSDSSQTNQFMPALKAIHHETSQKSSMVENDKNIYMSIVNNHQKLRNQFKSFNSRNLGNQSPGNSNHTNLFSNISNIRLSSLQKLESLEEKLKQSKSDDDELAKSLN